MFSVFAFRIKVSMILKMIKWNYQLTKQNWLVEWATNCATIWPRFLPFPPGCRAWSQARMSLIASEVSARPQFIPDNARCLDTPIRRASSIAPELVHSIILAISELRGELGRVPNLNYRPVASIKWLGGAERVAHINSPPPASVPRLKHTSS